MTGIKTHYTQRSGRHTAPQKTPTSDRKSTPSSAKQILISATFTAVPIMPGLEYWSQELALECKPELLEYNQVFKELLQPGSRFRKNENGLNVILLRFEDWLPYSGEPAPEYTALTSGNDDFQQLKKNLLNILHDFVRALQAFQTQASCRTLIIICPNSEKYQLQNDWKQCFQELGSLLPEQIQNCSLIQVINADEFHAQYQLEVYDDPLRNKIGHIPFTDEYFDFLSTLIIRYYHWMNSKNYKVIVLDCDNTLWSGVCGEVNPEELKIHSGYQEFQQFLAGQKNKGILLCLCSKNTAEDVWNVFQNRPDFPLKKEDITDYRINWQQKSVNLHSLAVSLNLGLDSFIFIDDNPVECAEVQANCPEVLTLQWPQDKASQRNFICHTWVFDHFSVTSEDENRTLMMQQNIQRQTFLNECTDFEDFLRKLNLEVEIFPMEPDNLARVSQLTKRTNQFNFTTIRRSENTIRDLLEKDGYECLIVNVKDRFGDYGLVGLIIYFQDGLQLTIDSFMLSCRVLGRGVEHRMMAEIGKIALVRKLTHIAALFAATEKNKPAKEFLENIVAQIPQQTKISCNDEQNVYLFEAAGLSDLQYHPSPLPVSSAVETSQTGDSVKNNNISKISSVGAIKNNIVKISQSLTNIRQISAAIRNGKTSVSIPSNELTGVNGKSAKELYTDILAEVIEIFGRVLIIDIGRINPNDPLESFVNNSMKIVDLTVELQKRFTGISNTFLFENSSIAEIASKIAHYNPLVVAEFKTVNQVKKIHTDEQFEVAIIGMNGKFPKAGNIEEFWHNLLNGISCISEVPGTRWDIDLYFDPTGTAADKSHSRWGGFIDDVDCFDTSFFNIAPKEAELIDPQQRIFLEVVWGLLEDACYTRENLPGDTGVFVGVISNDYSNYVNEASLYGLGSYRYTDIYQIPNRISYFMNLHGPSIAVDTACSASGTAVHLAFESLKRGESSCAIVGGVNLFLHPSRYIQYSQMQILAKTDKCCPFGADAAGTIFGEGICALLLKPLHQARQDHDNIYAVIKGTAVNSGGKTNGFTVPNPNSQAELVTKALKASQIDLRTISYVEAHGTGTPLGDPIEVQGLTKAFQQNDLMFKRSSDTPYCALGTVKANIGHLESGAAVAGIIKTVLQLKNKVLAPSLNSKVLNPLIPFESSPFYVPQKLLSWDKPVIEDGNGHKQIFPRRAGVNSFGAGGSNAHIILEEYEAEEKIPDICIPIIILSAKNDFALKKMALNLRNLIGKNNYDQVAFSNLAYSLQIGREDFKYRLAIIADSADDLRDKLDDFLAEKENPDKILTGIARTKLSEQLSFDSESDNTFLLNLLNTKEYTKIAAFWILGIKIDWDFYYKDKRRPRRISLPTYPFAREHYWVPEIPKLIISRSGIVNTPIHPLLQQNTSVLSEQRYSSVFTGQEFFLKDYKVFGKKFLPGTLHPEMVRAAISEAMGLEAEVSHVIKLKNLLWMRPIEIDNEAIRVHIGIYPEDNGEMAYEIYRIPETGEPEAEIYGQGNAVLMEAPEAAVLDLNTLQAGCSQGTINADEIYDIYKNIGLEYGPGYCGIERIYMGEGRVLAELFLPDSVAATNEKFLLHPVIMDGAFQAVIGFIDNFKYMKLWQTFTIKELEFFYECSRKMWVSLRSNTSLRSSELPGSIDMDLCDESGRICVRLKGLQIGEAVKPAPVPIEAYQSEKTVVGNQEEADLLIFEELWQEETIPRNKPLKMKTMICFLTSVESQQMFIEALQSIDKQTKVIFIAQADAFQKQALDRYGICRNKPDTFEELFENIRADYREVDAVMYLWALEDQNCINDYSAIMYLLQTLKKRDLKVKRIQLGARYHNDLERCYLESWLGFERSLGLIMPDSVVMVACQSVSQKELSNESFRKILTELRASKPQSVFYEKDRRLICRIRELTLSSEESLIKAGGTYLITGGCGGLGSIFAEHLAKEQPVNLILCGRSAFNSEKRQRIKELEDMESKVIYLQADVCDIPAMKEGLRQARERFGKINGVIHAAGLIGAETIMERDYHSFLKVLEPKIQGTLALEEILQGDTLDFICYFSSTSAIIGDFGSCDYAIGNRFLSAYARYRNLEEKKGKLSGKTVVINWPLWKDGGMGVGDNENTEMYLRTSGQRKLEAEEGLMIFERALAGDGIQYILFSGQPNRIRRFLGLVNGPVTQSFITSGSNSQVRGRRSELKGLSIAQCLEWELKENISQLLKINREKIDKEENLADFGFDSISLAEFAKLLSGHYGIEITPALFFGYSTLVKLIEYFLTVHQETIEDFYKQDTSLPREPEKITIPVNAAMTRIKSRRSGTRFMIKDGAAGILEPIAIIGMSGRFPEARNIEELWEILNNGEDVVREIPPERFDWWVYYGDPEKEPDKTNCKWCGCLPGVREFDPLFFETSPREAETMDPRQRLLLQESWKALEDAGYGPEQIRTNKIGMFVGAEQGEYQTLTQGEGNITSNLNGILAARLAYFLNLNGPVMAIDTACSSGLVAAHQAILSLRNQECDTAIAAGVNLMLTPGLFIAMSQAGMLSSDGKCYVFDKRADGIVPGEAVAAVVLKRLSKAKADGDPIYAVIKGSGINYDGKTNGITAPSGVSQTSLLKTVYDQHQVNPEKIEYIVTHGTGTKLGDPIEINALYDAFKDYTKKERYCALTSTKANFGHTFAASGLVSLINLVQAFRHGTIPASLHCEEENDYINWKESPFYVNKANKPWPAQEGKARLGAVSAFGISGTNAHIVVESYEREDEMFGETLPYYLLVFSAKTQEALDEKIRDLIAILENGTIRELALATLSYTLLEGRHHFNYRCAIIIQDQEHAVYLLKQVINKEKTPNVFYGKVPREFTGQKAIEQYAQDLLKQSRSLRENKDQYQETIFALADLYCQGYRMKWGLLFGDHQPERIHLPTYPFSRESYWVPESVRQKNDENNKWSAVLHPLLQQNTSDLSEQRFSSTFTGREFFLTDHMVKGRRVLPGVAYLEMARAAVVEAVGSLEDHNMIKLKNVIWARPIGVGEKPVRIHIGLYPEDNGEIAYEVYSVPETGEAEAVIYSQGSAVLVEIPEVPVLDLPAIQEEYNQKVQNGAEVYDFYKAIGLEYGPSHRGIEQLYAGKDGVLAKLSLPATVSTTMEQFVLHPSLMDSALQAVVGIKNPGDGRMVFSRLSLPFALQELEIYQRCTASMWVLIRYSKGSTAVDKIQKLDLDLCNDSGEVCVRMKGYSARILEGGISETGPSAMNRSVIFEPVWKEQVLLNDYTDIISAGFCQHLVILCEPGEITPVNVESGLKNTRVFSLYSKQKNIEKRFEAYTIKVFNEIQAIIQTKNPEKTLVQIVIAGQAEQQLFAGLSGLLKTAQIENSRVIGQLIEIEQWGKPAEIIATIKENTAGPMNCWIRYHNGKRLVAGWNEVTIPAEAAEIPWKDKGVYLISGGAGGLGMIFAGEITTRVKDTTLILTGRSLLNPAKEAQLKGLESTGAGIIYRQVDISDHKAVNELIRGIETEFGKLDGIIHCAGVIRDNYIMKKTAEEFAEVLAPKVAGLVNLDTASQNLNLDFMILFSSTSGSLGNPGQADYAAANAFMDMYANYRNELVSNGQRYGRTISINWPLWQEGGMQVDEAVEKMLYQSMGMTAMCTHNGIRALYAGMSSGKGRIMVIEGNPARIKQKLLSAEVPAMVQSGQNTSISNAMSGFDAGSLQEKIQNILMQAVSKMLKVKMENIDTNTELHEYGFDSISLTQFANMLNVEYKLEINPTVFFEYPTIHSLAGYLVKEYQTIFAALFAAPLRLEPSAAPAAAATKEENLFTQQPRCSRFAGKMPVSVAKPENTANTVAIIGMSGIFPQARDLDEFWQNLIHEKDCISEIPRDRWDWEDYYGDPHQEINKSNIKWGGFIDGVAEFDPLFFGISPREAELMDPQQRLLMIYVWKAIEDAGYSVESLSGTKTGIFVGTANTGYERLIAQANVPIEGYSSTGSVISIGPNRMSFFLNIHGPSEPIETACSSSLVAIHRAVNAIENGHCEMAIVGGINTIITPENHISFNKAGMLSEDGRCKTFSAQANGYVRGEGAGMLFLKKLKDAEEAGDHIYGVIRGTAENHGGRANSLTAPNPKAQAELLQTAYQKAGINPRTVTYIEAHGTGTELGDPIEINGLKAAFKELYRATGDSAVVSNHCGLGSVKTNIGHLELAAGVAGVIKVLLQLKYKTLVKSLHCETMNPYIQLNESPFYIVQEQREWEALRDNQGREIPRRAGVSSFGFGGVNAHVVIEEYIPRERQQLAGAVIGRIPVIIVLSAKNEDRLKDQAKQLLSAIRRRRFTDDDLADIAYTLQVGRQAMEERLAMLVGSIEELKKKLESFLEGKGGIADFCQGQVKRNIEALAIFTADEELQEALNKWLRRGKYDKLINLWVKGLIFDWRRLYEENKARRISLPTYPFAAERYWVPFHYRLTKADSDLPIPKDIVRQASVSGLQFPTGELLSEISYLPIWEEQPLASFIRQDKQQTVLIVYSESPYRFEKTIRDYYQQNGLAERIIQIQLKDQTKQLSKNKWCCDINDSKGFESCLSQYDSIDTLYFIAACQEQKQISDLNLLAQSQQTNEIQLFRLIKCLKHLQMVNHRSICYILTRDNHRNMDAAINPYGGGISGLTYSIAQGEYRFSVRNIDISTEDLLTSEKQLALMRLILNEGSSGRGDLIKFNDGIRYKQEFLKVDMGGFSEESGIKKEGTYVILGGSGTVGEIITCHLIKKYHARVIWIGRKPDTERSLREKIESLRCFGEPPLYIQADVTSLEQMKEAVKTIKKRYANINGAIFSGLVFNPENSIAKTDETGFLEIINVKTKGSINFYTAFQDIPMDFMCYFSSAQAFAFSGATNLSAYASGITFSDTFVRFIRQRSGFPIGTINWGFWKSSIDGTPLLTNNGVLEDREGIECFERFIGLLRKGIIYQVVCLKTSAPVRELMQCREHEIVGISKNCNDSMIETLWNNRVIGQTKDQPLFEKYGNDQEIFNMWIAKLLFIQIKKLGLFAQNGIWEERTVLPKLGGVIEKYDRFFQECLNILETSGYVQLKKGLENDLRICVVETQVDEEEKIWHEWEKVKESIFDDPQWRNKTKLVEACLKKLPDILQGRVLATDILFPGSSMELVEGVYKDGFLEDYCNQLVADAVAAYIRKKIETDSNVRAGRTKVRIIEIGAGTGSTSVKVFASVKPYLNQIEYCYTDISKSFLGYAKEKYGPDNPFLDYKQWNIEKSFVNQGIEMGGYDLAIATNVLHATKNIRQTIRNAKAALKMNGIMILNEVIRKSIFTTLTFGLLDGWWLYEDGQLRIPGSPLLDSDTWQKMLNEEGFRHLQFPVAPVRELGLQVFAGETDGLIRLELNDITDYSNLAVGSASAAGNRKEIGERLIPVNTVNGVVDSNASWMKELNTSDPLVDATRAWLIDLLAKDLMIDASKFDMDTPFQEYGMDSILLAVVIKKMDRELKVISLEPSVFLEYPTIKSIVDYLVSTYPEAFRSLFSMGLEKETIARNHHNPPLALQTNVSKVLPENKICNVREKIAVVGMACHFPDAGNILEYWENLKSGKDSICEVPKSRWDWKKLYSPQYQTGNSISKWGAYLNGIEEFDPGFFKIPEYLVPQIDPLQRQWLEVSAEALTDAGYEKNSLWGERVGVFVGARTSKFPYKAGINEKDYLVGTGQNFIAAHLAHIYNFKGPNMIIDTACSSSLTAIHSAVRSIQNGESEVALAGGVEILLDEYVYLALSASKILSPEGRCKTFDATADGIGIGEGCGVLVLKPLSKAIHDHNKIYGVIEGSAINNDGNTMGVTTPNPEAQQDLIERAIADANIDVETIGYVETHGTGTLIGDPIELKALTRVFNAHTSKKQFCGVGSVKSNMGHQLCAAGVAGIIKVLLAITGQELPPSLHCSSPNPRFAFSESPFYVVQGLKKWSPVNHILRAGISAFGLGGNNAHIILSNEGFPDTHRAGLEPIGKKITFHRKRYWPGEPEGWSSLKLPAVNVTGPSNQSQSEILNNRQNESVSKKDDGLADEDKEFLEYLNQ